MSVVALLASPLLGSAVWDPAAAALRARGLSVVVVDVGDRAPASADEALRALLARLPADERLALVPHSNAGLFVPALAAQRSVVATVFVDASVPPLDGGAAALVPPDFYEFLAAQADADGLLPIWSQWWEEDLSGLFGDSDLRARVEQQQHRLPLSYFRDALPVPAGWTAVPCAYLAFGGTYESQLDTARQCGWPVRVLEGDHLEMTVHPDAVAREIAGLLAELGAL